jgi:glucokinase
MDDPQPLVQDRLSHNSWGFLGTQGHILGLDLGSYGLRAALIDLHSHTYHRAYRESSASSARELLAESIGLARELLEQHGVANDHLVRIGVGFAGPVDARHGVVQLSPRIPGWEQFPLKERIEETFGAVTLIDNDANLIALAESTFGAGRDVQNLFYLHLSSGVGGGLVLDGHLYHGATTMAGEIGHTVVGSVDPIHPSEPPRTLEQLVSIQGIVRRASELGLRTDRLAEIFGAPQIGPQITAEVAETLAVRISQTIGLIDPQMIILGGVVTRSGGPALISAVEERVHHYMSALIDRPIEIVSSVLGFESVAIGALALALESMNE